MVTAVVVTQVVVIRDTEDLEAQKDLNYNTPLRLRGRPD